MMESNMKDSGLLEKECQLETQSGFLLVLKGMKDKALLSVRRKVGTPPQRGITFTPDELKRFQNLVNEITPGSLPAAQGITQTLAKEVASIDRNANNFELGAGEDLDKELDTFIEREYPELAQKRRKSARQVSFLDGLFSQFFTASPFGRLLAMGALVLIAGSGASLFFFSSLKPEKKPFHRINIGQNGSLAIEETARWFVLNMLNFKKNSYRQSQIRAMALMTPELSNRYWDETHFPLSSRQLATLPQDDEVKIVVVNSEAIAPGIYQVDVHASHLAGHSGSQSPVLIRLTLTQDATGKYLVSEQKDLSASLAQKAADEPRRNQGQ
jgi:hypothetical protein